MMIDHFSHFIKQKEMHACENALTCDYISREKFHKSFLAHYTKYPNKECMSSLSDEMNQIKGVGENLRLNSMSSIVN